MAKDKAHYPKDISGDWWRDIPGYEGLYQASRDGQIRKVWKSGKVSLMQPNKKRQEDQKRYTAIDYSSGLQRMGNARKWQC